MSVALGVVGELKLFAVVVAQLEELCLKLLLGIEL